MTIVLGDIIIILLTDSVLESSGVDLDFAELAIILSQRHYR